MAGERSREVAEEGMIKERGRGTGILVFFKISNKILLKKFNFH